MIRYEFFREYRYDRLLGFYETYGISVFENGRLIRSIRDISTERDRVSALTQRFNSEQLETCHLDQAMEEFLYDFKV